MTKKIAGLDIETLDLERTKPVVFEIGIVSLYIDDQGFPVGQPIKCLLNPSIQDQLLLNRRINPQTRDWHIQQHGGDQDKFNERLACASTPVQEVHSQLACLLLGLDELWINGLSFDPVVLHYLFQDFGLPLPWDFRKECDVRTIRPAITAAGCSTPEVPGMKHSAVPDAEWNIAMALAWHQVVMPTLRGAHALRPYSQKVQI